MGMMIGSRMFGGGGMEPALFVSKDAGSPDAPLCAGNYLYNGPQRGLPHWVSEDGSWFCWANATPLWFITEAIDDYTVRWRLNQATFAEGTWTALAGDADDAYVTLS